MKENQSSTTALGIAAMRAMESARPPRERICYDPLAKKLTSRTIYLASRLFSGYGERVAPGTQGYIVCRCRYFDDYLRSCIEGGAAQVVILGAGLDSRGYRREIIPETVRVFEVDHPATQRGKTDRIRRILGRAPGNLSYVAVDFNETSLDELLRAGYDASAKSLFLWEGVSYYLSPRAVDETLHWIASHAARGSFLIFDYVYAAALSAAKKRGEIRRMQRYRRLTGEGLTFGIEEGTIEGFLAARGFTAIVTADHLALERLYCTGANHGRAVAESYAIVHAEVAGLQ